MPMVWFLSQPNVEKWETKSIVGCISGVQTVAKKLDMMNAQEFATLVNEARANDNQSPVFPNPNNPYYFPEISALGEG